MNDVSGAASFPGAGSPDAPRPSIEQVKRLLAEEAGLPSRLRYTTLLLAGLCGAGVTLSLLLTEPELPGRTRIAFTLLTGIGLAWAAFAAWVLARRRVLFAVHRVVAARMAIAFTGLFTLGALALGRWGGDGVPWAPAAGTGIALLGTAAVLLVRARRRVAALERRRRQLEREVREWELG
jgi:hypothetical protein